jgi:hypothetical protein
MDVGHAEGQSAIWTWSYYNTVQEERVEGESIMRSRPREGRKSMNG